MAHTTTSPWMWFSAEGKGFGCGMRMEIAIWIACLPILRSIRVIVIRKSCRRSWNRSQKLTLTSRAFRNDQLGPFYKELCELTHSHKVLPMNSGAEAVETAIKTVRKWGYTVKGVPENEAEIIVCENNFHGRTISIVSFSTDPNARKGFGPFTPGFKVIPYGDAAAFRSCNYIRRPSLFLWNRFKGRPVLLFRRRAISNTVREICTQQNVMLILDEIQTGLGRTGKLLAEEHEGIEADLTLIGKALSGGFYPVSAVLSNSEVMNVLQPGEHGSTFGGNPLACAVARTALKVLIDEGMIENAEKMGAVFLDGLKQIANPLIKDVRGKGLMIAMEFYPEAGGARQYCLKLKEKGLLCKETHDHTIRFAPPLIITQSEVEWALDKIIA